MIKRDATVDILNAAKYFSVIAILGPRQSGKTTLAQTIFNNHRYVSLEDLDLRAAAKQDPRTFLLTNRNEHGIIIDEFQHVPDLLSYIQTAVDKEHNPGTFVLTGSQNFLMNQAISQSLAGRVSIHTLLPLSMHELKQSNLLPKEIEPMLYQGCYPAIYARHMPPELLYKNYMQTYIERDVRSLGHVGDLSTFQMFISLCAARTGQLLNITSLGNDCGISDTTARRWLSILEASYIIFFVRPYHTNFGKRLIKSPKLYFYDPGLACYLLKIKSEEISLHPNKGNLFEGLIISEVLKWHYNHGKLPSVYFWQDKTGKEIDCIIEEGTILTPVEIKAGRTISSRFFEGLEFWNTLTESPKDNGFVVFAGAADQPRGYPNIVSWQSMDMIFDKLK